jgi:hypothetical protein
MMDSFPKYLILQERNLNPDFCVDTEDDAIKRSTRRVSEDAAQRPVTIYKAIKVVRPRETPVVVDDLPE